MQSFTELYRALQSFTELYRALQSFAELCRALQSFAEFIDSKECILISLRFVSVYVISFLEYLPQKGASTERSL